MPELLSLSDEHCSNYQFKLNSNIFEEKHYGQHKTLIDKYRTSCAEFGITLTIVEYYLENCEDILYDKENIYYYNSDMVKYSNLLTSDGAGEWNIITASKKGNFS